MRVQKAENVTKALDFIASRGVKLTNIGPEGEVHMVPYTVHLNDILLMLPFYRHYRWKPEANSGNDLDAYPPIHHCRHQVCTVNYYIWNLTRPLYSF